MKFPNYVAIQCAIVSVVGRERPSRARREHKVKVTVKQLNEMVSYYSENSFGYNGIEDYVDTELPMLDSFQRCYVITYIRENI